jgi:hypothetical protein
MHAPSANKIPVNSPLLRRSIEGLFRQPGPTARRRSASFSLQEAGQPGLQSSSFQSLNIFFFSRKMIRVKVAARTFELTGAGLDADKKVSL